MEICLNQKGGETLIERGFIYTIERKTKDKTIWRCVLRSQCKVRVHSEDGVITLRSGGEHMHAPDLARIEIIRAKQALCQRASETQDAPVQIITDVIANLSQDAAAKAPTLDALRQTVHHVRRTVHQAPPNPTSVDEIVLPQNYQQTLAGKATCI